jgi:hypothetical protein
MFAGPNPVSRGRLAEDADELARFHHEIVTSLYPEDAFERAWACRIANDEVRLARMDRYEAVGLADAGRLGDEKEDEQLLNHLLDRRMWITGLAEAREALESDVWPGDLGAFDWTAVLVILYAQGCVPPNGPRPPDLGDELSERKSRARSRRFLVEKVVPPAGRQVLLDNVTARLGEVREQLAELEAREEEMAVNEATEPRGVLDQISVIRSRTQRALDKEREGYFKHKRRRRGANASDEAGAFKPEEGF